MTKSQGGFVGENPWSRLQLGGIISCQIS